MRQQVPKGCAAARPQQSLLLVARRCRDCGENLRALEGALHQCTFALTWPFAIEAVGGPWSCSRIGGGVGICRIARICGGSRAAPAHSQLEPLWEFIRGDLGHSMEMPKTADLADGSAMVLIGLRGREAVGFLWVERRAGSAAVLHERMPMAADGADGAQADIEPVAQGERRCRGAGLGVVLIWARRTERRRGLASALVEKARELFGRSSEWGVDAGDLAFSQPTNSGFAFAAKYTSGSRNGSVLVY